MNPIFHGKQHILRSLRESQCVGVLENPFFIGQNQLALRTHPNPLFPHDILLLLCEDTIFPQALFKYCIHLSNPLNIQARETDQAGGALFS